MTGNGAPSRRRRRLRAGSAVPRRVPFRPSTLGASELAASPGSCTDRSEHCLQRLRAAFHERRADSAPGGYAPIGVSIVHGVPSIVSHWIDATPQDPQPNSIDIRHQFSAPARFGVHISSSNSSLLVTYQVQEHRRRSPGSFATRTMNFSRSTPAHQQPAQGRSTIASTDEFRFRHGAARTRAPSEQVKNQQKTSSFTLSCLQVLCNILPRSRGHTSSLLDSDCMLTVSSAVYVIQTDTRDSAI